MKNKKIISIILIVLLIIASIIIGILSSENLKKNEYKIEKIEKYSYFKLYENEKYGVIDDKGNILIEAKFDTLQIPNPTKDVFVCYTIKGTDKSNQTDSKVLNSKGEEILTQYKEVVPLICEVSTSNIPFEKSVLQYKENEKYGLIDYDGNKITNAIYDEIKSLEYREGTLKVKKENKYGLINIKGKEIIKPEYENIKSDQYYSKENEYMDAGFIVQVKLEDGYRYGYVNKNGKKIIETEYNNLSRISELQSEDIYLITNKNGKNGVLKNTQTILNNEYENIEYNKANNLFIVQKSKKQGLMSIDGKEILPINFDNIVCSQNKIMTKKGDITEVYNNKGEKQNIEYKNIIETSNENYTVTVDENNKYGVINKNSQVLIKNIYDNLEYVFDNYFIATKNNKVGVIDINTGVVVDYKYDIIQKIKDKNILQAIISENNTIDMYNQKIEKQLSISNSILYTYDNYIKLISKNDIEYLDNNGNKISSKDLFKNNKLLSYNKDGKWGFLDTNNTVVVETKYDLVTEFNQYGFAGIKKDDKWGVIDETGKIIVDPKYKIEWNEPDFIGQYCKSNFGYGYEYYTNELVEN